MEKYLWSAIFKNRKSIHSIDRYGKEHMFKEVIEDIGNLSSFILSFDNSVYEVLLEEGRIFIYNKNINYYVSPEKISEVCSVIYFRRNTVTLSGSFDTILHDIKHHLGFSYKDTEGIIQKFVIIIDENGNLVKE